MLSCQNILTRHLLRQVNLKNLRSFATSSRCLVTGYRGTLFQKAASDLRHTNAPEADVNKYRIPRIEDEIKDLGFEGSRSVFEDRIKEKFGSRLVGWDPRSTNDGQPSIIYKGILKDQIRMLKIFSFTTTAMGLALQAVLVESLKDSSLIAKTGVFGIIGFFVFVSPLLIQLMAKRYVTELRYDPQSDTYTSVTFSFFLRRNEVKFKVEDVIIPTVPGLLTTILVKSGDKKLPLFLADFGFDDLKHFGRIMGYDKPIDFEITETDVKDEMVRRRSKGA